MVNSNIKSTYWEEFKLKYNNIVLLSPMKEEIPVVSIKNPRAFCYKYGELSDVLLMQLIKGKISKYRGWKIITY